MRVHRACMTAGVQVLNMHSLWPFSDHKICTQQTAMAQCVLVLGLCAGAGAVCWCWPLHLEELSSMALDLRNAALRVALPGSGFARATQRVWF